MSKFSAHKSSLRLLSCILAFCMCITLFANVAGVIALAETTTDYTVWSGGSYDSLSEAHSTMTQDNEGYYHITTAEQLHGVIKNNGGGNKYKLDNDLYLNENFENYSDWGVNTPARSWDFTGHSNNVPTYKFYGTIDGCGHTVYGLYNGTGGKYAGLIGAVYDTTVIENLNVRYAYIKGAQWAGAIIGGNWSNSPTTTTISISGCSVRDVIITNIWNNGGTGGIIGLTTRKTTITNCSVADVEFESCVNSGANFNSCFGSFIGAFFDGAKTYDNGFQTWQAQRAVIKNSYAVNNTIKDTSGNIISAYVCGLYYLSGGTPLWCYCVTAENVYTDSTDIPVSGDGNNVKLMVSANGTSAIDPSSENYPIKNISADSIKGTAAKTAMPALNWTTWNVVDNDYPVYKPLEIWSGSSSYSTITDVITDLGYADEDGYYHIATAEQLHGVIKNNGGGYKYKLDNDLYLNEDFENYASWTNTNGPANVWDFTSSKASPTYKFSGTIDGCGHTIYGLYSKKDLAYGGLIGNVAGNTTVKNLNVYNSYVRAANSTGIIIGGNWYSGSAEGMKIEIIGCSVRNAIIDNVWNNGSAGGLIGMTSKPTVVSNCSVINVKMKSGAGATDANKFGGMGAFVGAVYAAMGVIDPSSYDVTQGSFLKINDSYAVDVINVSDNNAPIYVSGLYMDGTNWNYSMTANNIYTDATAVTTNTAGTVSLMVSADGQTAIEPTAENYPIRYVDGDALIGESAKTAMPLLNWNAWTIVEDSYPVYSDLVIWDGEETFATIEDVYASMSGSGTEASPYIITDADQLHGAIRLGGGGKYYKLSNDLYLNSDWANYASWSDSNAPANDWGLYGSNISFSGTIDGNNKAIYGYYNKGTGKEYVGLIPAVNTVSGAEQSVTIKNLDMLYCAHNGATKVGFLIGATWSESTGSVTIENTTVKHASIYGLWDSNAIGGMVGIATNQTAVTINHSAVEDIDFKALGNGTTGFAGYASYGAFVGCTNSNRNDAYFFSSGQAQSAKIYNSYAFDCVNTKNEELIYVCGIYPATLSSYCVTAVNVYTDATTIPESIDGYCKLLVSEDSISESNTVKVPSIDNYAPFFADGAWYMGEFGDNSPILKCRTEGYAYLDITGDGLEDKYNAVDVMYLRKHLLGVAGYEYINGDVNNDVNNEINISDLVRIKKILVGK